MPDHPRITSTAVAVDRHDMTNPYWVNLARRCFHCRRPVTASDWGDFVDIPDTDPTGRPAIACGDCFPIFWQGERTAADLLVPGDVVAFGRYDGHGAIRYEVEVVDRRPIAARQFTAFVLGRHSPAGAVPYSLRPDRYYYRLTPTPTPEGEQARG